MHNRFLTICTLKWILATNRTHRLCNMINKITFSISKLYKTDKFGDDICSNINLLHGHKLAQILDNIRHFSRRKIHFIN